MGQASSGSAGQTGALMCPTLGAQKPLTNNSRCPCCGCPLRGGLRPCVGPHDQVGSQRCFVATFLASLHIRPERVSALPQAGMLLLLPVHFQGY